MAERLKGLLVPPADEQDGQAPPDSVEQAPNMARTVQDAALEFMSRRIGKARPYRSYMQEMLLK